MGMSNLFLGALADGKVQRRRSLKEKLRPWIPEIMLQCFRALRRLEFRMLKTAIVALALLVFAHPVFAACANGERIVAVDGTTVCVLDAIDNAVPDDTLGACVMSVKQPGHVTPTHPATVPRIGINVSKKACDAAGGELHSFQADK